MRRVSTTSIGLGVVLLHLAFLAMLISYDGIRVLAPAPAAMQVSVVPASDPAAEPRATPSTHARLPATPARSTPGAVVSQESGRRPEPPTVPMTGPSLESTAKEADAKESGRAGTVRSAPRVDAAFGGNLLPDYPTLSRRLGEHGTVALRVMIGADGRAGEVQVVQSSGYPRLDRSAADAIRQWRFSPAYEGGKPVPAWYEWRWTFRLN